MLSQQSHLYMKHGVQPTQAANARYLPNAYFQGAEEKLKEAMDYIKARVHKFGIVVSTITLTHEAWSS